MPDPTPAPRLLIAAHGTKSAVGAATTQRIAAAVTAARPDLSASLCYLDVLKPSLRDALDATEGPVVLVPMVLSAGYHVLNDIPAVVAERSNVRVARHLGPDPVLVDVLVTRLSHARRGREPASTALVAIASSRAEAQAEVHAVAALLSEWIGRKVTVVPRTDELRTTLASLPSPVEVVPYLLVEGTFLDSIEEAISEPHWAADPIGADPAIVQLVLQRYEEVAGPTVR